MAERCPLCQGKLQNGECVSCGYRIPDEDDISALYNYDPSDYPQPEEEHIREIIPDVQMEEIYPDRPDPIDIKVRNDQGKTIGQNGNFSYGQQGQYGQPLNGQGSPYIRAEIPVINSRDSMVSKGRVLPITERGTRSDSTVRRDSTDGIPVRADITAADSSPGTIHQTFLPTPANFVQNIFG